MLALTTCTGACRHVLLFILFFEHMRLLLTWLISDRFIRDISLVASICLACVVLAIV
jgi:hypothetical protein